MMMRRMLPAAFLLFGSPAFAQATIVPMGTDANDPNNSADTEPSIAVNPTNVNDIVVVAFSDNWGLGTNASIWRSSDHGATWSKSQILPQPGEGLQGPGDQKVSFDRNGNLLVAELGSFPLTDFIFRQTGAAGAALTVGAGFGDDQPHLDVDRNPAGVCAGRVYAPWLNTNVALAQSNVTNSSNGGAAVTNVAAGSNAAFANRTTRLALGPDGSAYIIYKTREGLAGGMFENAHFRVDRSDDCGANWGANSNGGVSIHGPAAVRTLFTNTFGNSAKGKVTRARSSDAWIAVDQGSGDVYAAYVNQDASGFGQIYVARSTDRGVTWTTSRVTNGRNHSGFPEIAATDNGTVGVLYIDFDDSGTSTIFRHRFARSFNKGTSWSDETLQSMDPAPIGNAASGFIFGDYEGLTAHGTTFYGVFTGRGSGRTTTQLDPIFFRESGLRRHFSICITRPEICRPPKLGPGIVLINCTRLPCVIRDPIPRNCLIKFVCPGCPAGGLCPPYYTFTIDGVDPAWRVELFDPQGQAVGYQQRRTLTGTTISFRPDPQYFRDGKIGDYFFTFETDERSQLDKPHSIRMSLRASDEPFGSRPTRPR